MGQNRSSLDGGANNVTAAQGGDITMSQKIINSNTTVGAATLTAQQVLGGVLRRTGPTAHYIDTFPTADSLLQACPILSVGDAWELIHINTVAFTNTPAAGTGIVLGNETTMAASSHKRFLFTVLGNGITQVAAATTTNGSAVITNIAANLIANIRVGQGVSGTGIPANTYVIGVNLTAGTVTMSANATADGAIVAVTTFPRIRVDGIGGGTL